ncbi:hypothetical protein ACFE33_00345 [Falsihalocynthiibacter sp. SS001]|uniref:hypothetical protein n=1 Tax=Falsihalocynthiibacter sp. SS001 TaxID=3349698 RepID=UPI0036D26D70
MAFFTYRTTLLSEVERYGEGISDLAVQWNDGVGTLFATSQVAGGISAFRLDRGLEADLVSLSDYAQSREIGVSTSLETFVSQDSTHVISGGMQGTSLYSMTYEETGIFGGLEALSFNQASLDNLRYLTTVEVGKAHYLYATHSGVAGVSMFEVGSDLDLRYIGQMPLGDKIGEDVAGITTLTTHTASYLLVGSFQDNNITSLRISPSGTLEKVAEMGAEQGLGINGISAIATATTPTGNYILVAARGSSSISVLEMNEAGIMVPTDHVIDDLTTRFQHITSLDVTEVNGRTYVLAGGGDDGLSLFSLRPDGRLHHLTTIEDTSQYSLQNVAAVALTELDGELQAYATSATENGIDQFTISTANEGLTQRGTGLNDTITGTKNGDYFFGAGGDDKLYGGSGDDVLIDGAGEDQMYGGDGRDTFVLTQDGDTDWIRDFDYREDSLDFSGFVLFHDVDQLQIAAMVGGAKITFRGEVTYVMSENGLPIYPSQFYDIDVSNASRTPISWVLPEGAVNGSRDNDKMEGTDAADILYGLSGNDTLFGMQGDDTLEGGEGNDTLIGGRGSDYLLGSGGIDTVDYSTDADFGGTRGVRVNLESGEAVDGFGHRDVLSGIEQLIGTNADDVLEGDIANNVIKAGAGDDDLKGETGEDLIYGDTGSDRVWGGYGDDRLYGGDGADKLRGQNGDDVLYGEPGHDSLTGSSGNDKLYGGANNDTIKGGTGADKLFGQHGSDLLYGDNGDDALDGGIGHDTLFGGDGNDKIDGGSGSDKIFGNYGADHLVGGTGADYLSGSNGHDLLEGGDGHDQLYAGKGDDQLNGGDGNDYLAGSIGDDELYGANGDDILAGGSGGDKFLHNGSGSGGNDWVMDFDDREGDTLVFTKSAKRSDFSVEYRHISEDGDRLGSNSHKEALVIYEPTGRVLWTLVDGATQDHIDLTLGGKMFDLI